MRILSLFLLLGTLSIQIVQQPPELFWIVIVFCFLLAATVLFKQESQKVQLVLLALTGFTGGLLMASFSAQTMLNKRLLSQWQGQDIILQGKVIDIPNDRNDGVRFRFKINQAVFAEKPEDEINLEGIVRLGWYQHRQDINAGEKWQLRVRLKRPSGFLNPGGFDYEKWLFTERIIATGYIRKSESQNQRLSKASLWSINHWRQIIHQTIQTSVDNKSSAAVLSALLVAVRTDLDDQQWKQLQQTGTSHLVAISGLHIAIVAGFAFLPIMFIWWLFPRLNERIPLKVAGSISGVLFASCYAMLAGFTLPTQRALMMVIIALLALIARRNYQSSTILATALLAVLILDPLAAMTISFWLSFLAVALILIILNRQMKKPALQIIKLQLWLSLAMLPLTLFFFGTASLTSPVANLFAIPWVSLIVVPLSLLGLIFMPISSFLSDALLGLAGITIDWLFKALSLLSESPLGKFNPVEIPGIYLFFAFTGLLFLMLPKGFPGRLLGFLGLLPALLFTPVKPNHGEFVFSMLDVGQGMATVVHTAEHTLVYDTGTHVSDSFDIGKLVVVPYLKSKGINTVDQMIVSHEDIDHRGGAEFITKELSVNKILSSDTRILPNKSVEACIKGMKWQWDGVDFEILSPPQDYQQNDNNRSCVLRVSNQFHSLLLTGDIQQHSEKLLMKIVDKGKLKSEVMTVPHHGSKTSSTVEFINTVSPELALITAGYRSRFGHPKPEIVQRYKQNGVRLMDTVTAGAIQVYFPASAKEIQTTSFREQNGGFWSR